MLSALFAWLAALLLTLTPAPLPEPVPAPVEDVAHAPSAPHYAPLRPTAPAPVPVPAPAPAPVPVPAPPVAGYPESTTCAAGEEWQYGFGCVAVQKPEETTGRG